MRPFEQNIVTSESTQQTLFSYDSTSSIAPVNGKKVSIDFNGGSITSDAGVFLMSEVESNVKIIKMLADCTNDPRRQSSVTHPLESLYKQRIFQITCGYEDANDSNGLRKDPAMKMAVGCLPDSDQDLASQPTISRLENMITVRELYQMGAGFVDHFIASYAEPPEIIVLDFDDTNDDVHGNQQLAMFNGYYQETCYQPVHVYEGLSGKLIMTVLRPGQRPGGIEILSYAKRIIERIRQQWPETIIVYRGDSHYSAPEIFTYISRQKSCYSIAGLGKNKVLCEQVKEYVKAAEGQPIGYKTYHSFLYKAESWSVARRVIAKVEITEKEKLNVRFISTEMQEATPKDLYEGIYCARGNDELYIKDHKTYTKSDRTHVTVFFPISFVYFCIQRLMCCCTVYVTIC